MAKKMSNKQAALQLAYSGSYDIVQQEDKGPEQPYGGCAQNTIWILQDPDTRVQLLKETDPSAREGVKTYRISHPFYGKLRFIMWEV